MSDKYLWDRSGEPDADVERLEHLLGELRHRPGTLDYTRLPATIPASGSGWPWRRTLLAAAACSAAVLVTAGLWRRSPEPAQPAARPPALWLVKALTGAPTVAGAPLRGELSVGVDGVIETNRSSTVRLSASGVGMVDLGPDTRLRIVASSDGGHRLALDRGSVQANIWAAPGVFAVDTPSAIALDLGCSYTLEVDARGSGRLRVTLGWVGLGRDRVESLVPRDAVCALTPAGPSIPHFEDAPAALIDALAPIGAAPDATLPPLQLERALRAARPRDAFTLWHLMRRTRGEAAERVYARLAALSPPPAAVTRERVLANDGAALESWWNTFGLGDAALFAKWRARRGP